MSSARRLPPLGRTSQQHSASPRSAPALDGARPADSRPTRCTFGSRARPTGARRPALDKPACAPPGVPMPAAVIRSPPGLAVSRASIALSVHPRARPLPRRLRPPPGKTVIDRAALPSVELINIGRRVAESNRTCSRHPQPRNRSWASSSTFERHPRLSSPEGVPVPAACLPLVSRPPTRESASLKAPVRANVSRPRRPRPLRRLERHPYLLPRHAGAHGMPSTSPSYSPAH